MKLVQEHLLTTNYPDIKEIPHHPQPQHSSSSGFASFRKKYPANFVPTISAPLENPELAIASVSYVKLDPVPRDTCDISITDLQRQQTDRDTRNQKLSDNLQNLQKNIHNATPTSDNPTAATYNPGSPSVTSPTSPDSLNSRTLTSLSRYNLSGTFTDI